MHVNSVYSTQGVPEISRRSDPTYCIVHLYKKVKTGSVNLSKKEMKEMMNNTREGPDTYV